MPDTTTTLRKWYDEYRIQFGDPPTSWPVDHGEMKEMDDIMRTERLIAAPTRAGDGIRHIQYYGLPFFLIPDGTSARATILAWPGPMPSQREEVRRWIVHGLTVHSAGPLRVPPRAMERELPSGDWYRDFTTLRPATRSLAATGIRNVEHLEELLAGVRSAACHLCHGSRIQTRFEISGLTVLIACDCAEGRLNSNLCTIGNHRSRGNSAGQHSRRANVGGVNRNPSGELRIKPVDEVLAGLKY